MKFRFAPLLVVVLHACAPVSGYREVDSSRELFRLQVGDTARVDLASIEKENGVAVLRPQSAEISSFMGMGDRTAAELLKADRNEVLVSRSRQRGVDDCCLLRMEGNEGKAKVVKFVK